MHPIPVHLCTRTKNSHLHAVFTIIVIVVIIIIPFFIALAVGECTEETSSYGFLFGLLPHHLIWLGFDWTKVPLEQGGVTEKSVFLLALKSTFCDSGQKFCQLRKQQEEKPLVKDP